jgi:hypothetical protein
MGDRTFQPGFFDYVAAAASIPALVVGSPLLRPWYRDWGTAGDEATRTLPGDELVPEPRLQTTWAITIQAPAAEVWPWLAQLGQSRGGFYSYDALENMAGCNIHSTDRILSDVAPLQVGDQVRLGPEGYPYYVVADIDPGQALILETPEGVNGMWSFILDQKAERATRLITRTRLAYEPTVANVLIWRVFTDPISFVMGREMLRGIKRRAEGYRN